MASNLDLNVDVGRYFESSKNYDYEVEIAVKKRSMDEFEVTSLREECVKHFAQADGTIKAIVYPFPVHTLDEDGKWRDLFSYDESIPMNAERFESLRTRNNIVVNGYEEYDTYISQEYPSTNYFGNPDVIVGTNQTTYFYCTNPEIPDNATVVSSSVSYYYWFPTGVTSGIIFVNAYEAINNWNPFYLTYNNSGVNNGLSTTSIDTEYMVASSNISSSSPGLCSFDVTELTKDWYAGKPNYGIGLKRTSGSVSHLYMYSNNNNHHWPIYSVTYTLDELVIDDGYYYIRNAQLNKYLQENPYVNNILNEVLYTLDGGIYQQWYVKYLHNGFYRIQSVEDGKSLSIQLGYENSSSAYLIQDDYNVADRQQWHISMSVRGNMILQTKTSYENVANLVIMANSNNNDDGTEVIQSYYTNNADKRDEWGFVSCGEETYMLGIPDVGNHDHKSVFSLIIDNICFMGYTTFDIDYTDSIINCDLIDKILNSNIFVFRGHGNYGIDGGYIILGSQGTSTLKAEHLYDYNINQSIVDLSNNQIMLFVACYSGYGNNSIVDAAVASGASASIGFTEEIICQFANTWVESFFGYLVVEGDSLYNSAVFAGNDCPFYSGCRNLKIVEQ